MDHPLGVLVIMIFAFERRPIPSCRVNPNPNFQWWNFTIFTRLMSLTGAWTGKLVFLLLMGVLFLFGCEKRSIQGDFGEPFEHTDLLLPGATHSFSVTGPRGMSVDIAVDYDAFKNAEDPVQLVVQGSDARSYVGARVAGSGLPQAICGVSLEPRAGIQVKVRNLKLLRSIPFALRIEREPSFICSPHLTSPSMFLVKSFTRPSYRLGFLSDKSVNNMLLSGLDITE